MSLDESSPDSAADLPTLLSVLRELLDCTELNMDDLEDHTRVVIHNARAVLDRERKEP